MPGNAHRALSAHKAMLAFAGAVYANYEAEDDQTKLVDLLCDLMHWANARNVNFDQALASGRSHYQCEVEAGMTK